MSAHWDYWNDPGWQPPKPTKPVRTGGQRTLSALKWTGAILGLMCVAPFVLMAQFLRTFVRI